MGFEENKIRVIAIAVIRKKNTILAARCFDSKKNEVFYRPLGGGVEFGEEPEDAVIREFKEELGLDIKVSKLLKVSNNIFTFDGKKGHEVVFLFEAEFAYKDNYNKNSFEQTVDNTTELKVEWCDLSSGSIIYPEKIREYL
ncbi:MAG: NUDIX domain-containing protein [Lactobacillaceae bacterium]|jgi:ADP-ribose pyrophosphatase YjhB (NUDIX family)|nr:NUDIX domain-containing protein [Lactobacillaceae bacterium]